MVVALVLEATAACCVLAHRLQHTPSVVVGTLGRIATTGAVVLFPTVVQDVSRLLSCTFVLVSAKSLRTLDGGSLLNSQQDGVASVALLADNPYIVCWAGR